MNKYEYTPTTWIGGKTIGTADVMNNIEEGIMKAHEELEEVNSQLEQNMSDINEQFNTIEGRFEYKNVLEFGAKGDGVTDDTQAIKNALLSSNYVFFPAGIYLVNEELQITSAHRLKGQGHGKGSDTRFTTIKAISNINNIFNCYDTVNGVSSITIDGFMLDCNNLASNGIYCGKLTNGSEIKNIGIQNSLDTGLYVRKTWYAKFDNFFIINCGKGIKLDVEIQGSSDEGVNCISFDNFYLSNTQNLYCNGNGHATSFKNCTFEGATESNVKIDKAYGSISFYSCYWESSKKHDIEIIPAYANSGVVNLVGCYITQSSSNTYNSILTGNIHTLNIIGGFIISNSSTVDYTIKTDAKCNNLFSHINSTNNTVGSVYATGLVNGDMGVVYRQSEDKYTQTRVTTGLIECVSAKGYNVETPSNFEIGSTNPSNVDDGRFYRYGFKTQRGNDKKLVCYGVKRNGTLRGDDIEIFAITDNTKMFPNRLINNPKRSDQRPSDASVGECYFDVTLKKPIWWSGTNWVDGVGATV